MLSKKCVPVSQFILPASQQCVVEISLQVDVLLDQEVQHLSGGELQRVAITMCLGKPADIYLIDEPSAYLDSEQRIVAAKVATGGPCCPWASNTHAQLQRYEVV